MLESVKCNFFTLILRHLWEKQSADPKEIGVRYAPEYYNTQHCTDVITSCMLTWAAVFYVLLETQN